MAQKVRSCSATKKNNVDPGKVGTQKPKMFSSRVDFQKKPGGASATRKTNDKIDLHGESQQTCFALNMACPTNSKCIPLVGQPVSANKHTPCTSLRDSLQQRSVLYTATAHVVFMVACPSCRNPIVFTVPGLDTYHPPRSLVFLPLAFCS